MTIYIFLWIWLWVIFFQMFLKQMLLSGVGAQAQMTYSSGLIPLVAHPHWSMYIPRHSPVLTAHVSGRAVRWGAWSPVWNFLSKWHKSSSCQWVNLAGPVLSLWKFSQSAVDRTTAQWTHLWTPKPFSVSEVLVSPRAPHACNMSYSHKLVFYFGLSKTLNNTFGNGNTK